MKIKKILTFLLGFLILPQIVSAHGLVTTFTQTDGDYRIEFEYSTIGNIATNDFTTYTGHLFNAADNAQIEFDSAFLRITKDRASILSGNLHPIATGGFSMGGMISEPGDYVAELSFLKGDARIASASFNISVELAEQPSVFEKYNLGLILSFIAGAFAGLSFWLYKNKIKP